jgi:hypothetical protein
MVTKSEFARLLGVSRPTVSRYCKDGLPQLADGRLDEDAARAWVKANIRPHVSDSGTGGHIGATGADEADDALTDAEIDIARERARWQKARADKAEIEVERMKGGTEEEVKLKLIETVVHHLWWTFQRHSPHALTGRFIGNGWLNVKDGPSCARASSLILARDSEIMRQMATVVEDAISGNLEPVNGRRTDLVPWQQHQLEWHEEVGEVFQAEIDDRELLQKGQAYE